MPNSRVEVDTTVLDRILRNAPGNAADVIRAIAFSIEAKAKKQIQVMNAIDTGAMVNSVYTRTFKGAASEGSDTSEGQIHAKVLEKNPDVRPELEELPIPRGPHEAFVGPSVKYAIAVHYGSARMSGRPFLQNAVNDVTRDFERSFGNVATDGER